MNKKSWAPVFILLFVFFITTGFSLFGNKNKKEEPKKAKPSSSQTDSDQTEAENEEDAKTLPLAEVKRIREELDQIRTIEKQTQLVKVPSVNIPSAQVPVVQSPKIETSITVKPVVMPELPKTTVLTFKTALPSASLPSTTIAPLPPSVKDTLALNKQSFKTETVTAVSKSAVQETKKAQQ